MKSLGKTSLALGCALVLACFTPVNSARAEVTTDGVTRVDLIMGQNTVVGQVEAFALDGILFMNITTTGSYTIDLTHVAAGQTLASIPTNKKGNPKIGNFPFAETGGVGVQSIDVVIPLDSESCDVPFVVAVHAEVRDSSASGANTKAETAWAGGADGIPFNGGSWATYFNVSCLPADSD